MENISAMCKKVCQSYDVYMKSAQRCQKESKLETGQMTSLWRGYFTALYALSLALSLKSVRRGSNCNYFQSVPFQVWTWNRERFIQKWLIGV